MSPLQDYAGFKYFLVSSPAEYVAHVEINRPQKLNAFFEAMWHELARIFDKLSHDPAVRAVVFSGAGDRAFTAGLDVQATSLDANLSGGDGARSATSMRRHIDEFQECITRVEKCEKRECPVSAAAEHVFADAPHAQPSSPSCTESRTGWPSTCRRAPMFACAPKTPAFPLKRSTSGWLPTLAP